MSGMNESELAQTVQRLVGQPLLGHRVVNNVHALEFGDLRTITDHLGHPHSIPRHRLSVSCPLRIDPEPTLAPPLVIQHITVTDRHGLRLDCTNGVVIEILPDESRGRLQWRYDQPCTDEPPVVVPLEWEVVWVLDGFDRAGELVEQVELPPTSDERIAELLGLGPDQHPRGGQWPVAGERLRRIAELAGHPVRVDVDYELGAWQAG